MKLADVIREIRRHFPTELAESWDPVGLQVGDPAWEISSGLTAVDLTPPVLQEAVTTGASLILLHHPFIFEPLKNLRLDNPRGAMLQTLIQNRIAVYAVHTSADAVAGGINHRLAEALGLKHVRVLTPSTPPKKFKLAVFCPADCVDRVHLAMAEAGAGLIGNYEACAFLTDGRGRFRPLEGATPTVGEVGELEEAREVRLEMEVAPRDLPPVLQAMRAAHPYEEVAYDLVELHNRSLTAGIGRIGELPAAMDARQLATLVKETLDCDAVRVAESGRKSIRSVAVVCGAGFSQFGAALAAEADCLVTGDCKHHDALKAMAARVDLIDVDHYECEKIVKDILVETLGPELSGVTLQASRAEQSPFTWI